MHGRLLNAKKPGRAGIVDQVSFAVMRRPGRHRRLHE